MEEEEKKKVENRRGEDGGRGQGRNDRKKMEVKIDRRNQRPFFTSSLFCSANNTKHVPKGKLHINNSL